VNNGIPNLVAWPHIDQVNFRAVKIKHMALVEHGRRQDEFDPVEIVVLLQLHSRSDEAGVERLKCLTCREIVTPCSSFWISSGFATCFIRSAPTGGR